MQTTEVIFGEMSAEEEAALSPEDSAPEPSPEPEKAPEPAPEPEKPAEPEKSEPEKQDKPPEGHVPHGALHAERERRKAVEAELAEMREWRKGVEAKLNPPEEAPKFADPIEDPQGHAKWAAYREKREQEMAENFKRFEAQQNQQAEQSRVVSVLAGAEQEFRGRTPDYDAAIAHLQQARSSELQLLGYSPEQTAQTIRAEVQGLVAAAVQNGRNPAEVAYGIARARGYAPKAAAAPESGADKAAEESERLRKIAEGSKSLGGAAGGGASGDLTLEEVAEMSPEEIMALPEHTRMRIMGG